MLFILDPNNPNQQFPPVEQAEQETDGLVAVGGDLSTTRLLNAYSSGIFPWYSDDQPILWWSPDPRMILYPNQLKISRSLGKNIRNSNLTFTIDHAFADVMTACAAPRQNQPGTWITDDMKQAYQALFKLGHAHSVEVWEEDNLVGGVYGVAIGQVFFGESMFSRRNNASKMALAHLCERLIIWGYALIDCQVYSDHLTTLGAEEIPRPEFCSLLQKLCNTAPSTDSWQKESKET